MDFNFDDNDLRYEDHRTEDLIGMLAEHEVEGRPVPVDLLAVLEARGIIIV